MIQMEINRNLMVVGVLAFVLVFVEVSWMEKASLKVWTVRFRFETDSHQQYFLKKRYFTEDDLRGMKNLSLDTREEPLKVS